MRSLKTNHQHPHSGIETNVRPSRVGGQRRDVNNDEATHKPKTHKSTSMRVPRWLKKLLGRPSKDNKPPTPRLRACELLPPEESKHASTNGTHRRVLVMGAQEAPPRFHTAGSESINVLEQRKKSASSRSIYDYTETITLRSEIRASRASNAPPLVLIVGGGLAGLCLAHALKKAGITFTVFERDPSPNFTSQGYRVQIDTTGYEALKAALPADKFELFLQSTGEIFPDVVYKHAQTAETLHLDDGLSPPSLVFSVDRAMLRSLLLSGLEEGKEILFGLEFKRFHVLPNGRVEVHFTNGRFTQGSVLVGADGPTSKVRRQFLGRHVQMLDTNCAAIYGKTLVTPELQKLGLMTTATTTTTTAIVSQGPKVALIVEPHSATQLDVAQFESSLFPSEADELVDLHRYISWVLLARTELFHNHYGRCIKDMHAMPPHELAAVAVQMTSSWHPEMRAVVDRQATQWCSFMRISTTAPEIKPWTPRVVTLIGDAAHTMAPAGQGTNAALRDAVTLFKQFVEHGVTLEAVATYEQNMRTRATRGILKSLASGKLLYGVPSVENMEEVEF